MSITLPTKTDTILISLKNINRFFLIDNLLLIVLVTFIGCFFGYIFLGSKLLGHSWIGYYAMVDGKFFAWIAKAYLQWGSFFDTLVQNPLQGMVSLLLPYNAWWDPGALALSLPYEANTNAFISYGIYCLEILSSIYLLAKEFGFKKIESVIAAQLFIIMFFPPFSLFSSAMPFFTLGANFLHLIAIANIATVLFMNLGKTRDLIRNSVIFVLFQFACFDFVMAAIWQLINFSPFYGLICFIILMRSKSRTEIGWRLFALILLMTVLYFLKITDFLKDMGSYSHRVSSVIDHNSALSFNLPSSWKPYDLCLASQRNAYGMNLLSFLCPERGVVQYFNLFAFLGGLISIFWRCRRYQYVALIFCLYMIMPDILYYLKQNNVLNGYLVAINPFYYIFAAISFNCIFCMTFFASVSESIFHFSNKYKINKADLFAIPNFFKKISMLMNNKKEFLRYCIPFIVPLLCIGMLIKISKIIKVDKCSVCTSSVQYLKDKISLEPGSSFNGSAASYFGNGNALLRKIVKNNKENFSSYEIYTQARELFDGWYGNMHMFSDLWNHNIPTIEEYAQMINLPIFSFFKNMLANPNDDFGQHFLNVFKLDLKTLAALGVRFIISDKNLNEEGLRFILEQKPKIKESYINFELIQEIEQFFNELTDTQSFQNSAEYRYLKEIKGNILSEMLMSRLNNRFDSISKEEKKSILNGLKQSIKMKIKDENSLISLDTLKQIKEYYFRYLSYNITPPSLFLYEIKNPNLGTYSPTHCIVSTSASDGYHQMKKRDFSFERSVIVQEDIRENLIAVKHSKMIFEKNATRIQASSDGTSLLLIPLQYSHCLRLSNADGSPVSSDKARLMRANLIQTAILFKDNIDLRIQLKLKGGFDSACRKEDIKDMKDVDLRKCITSK